MSIKLTLAASAALAVTAITAVAAQAAPLDYIATMNGKCTRLVFKDRDSTSACSPNVINDVHKDGRTGFTFVVGDTAVITFSGMGQTQVKESADHVAQPLDTVIVSMIGTGAPPAATKATGACTYTNPYAGPAQVKCSAQTSNGLFEAVFLSDGQAPSIKHF